MSSNITSALIPLIEELLYNRDYIKLQTPFSTASIYLADPQKQSYHLDVKGMVLWRKNAWLQHEIHRAEILKQQAKYKAILDKRKEIANMLCISLGKLLNLPPNNSIVIRCAHKLLAEDAQAAAKQLGIDIKDIPKLPDNYINLDNPDILL
jgi:hypothetical protein